MSKGSYWTRKTTTRRAALRAAAAGGGLVALSLVGCGGDDDDKGAATTDSGPATDSAKGKPGGKFIFQANGVLANTRIALTPTNPGAKLGGLIHSGLYAFAYGRPPSNGVDADIETDLATAMPEQPDPQTLIVKIRPDAKFQNGRKVVASDVKYSFERTATAPESGRKVAWLWLDKIDATDDQTVVIKTKTPFADALASITAHRDAFIIAKEFEETPESTQKMMGSGPYIWVEDQPPIQARVRKNPDYYNKPYPYFDEITMLEAIDKEKQIADFSAKQVHFSFWFPEEARDRLKQNRPDAKHWYYEFAANAVAFRVDQPPFNDKRVRQALSMAIDQKKVREGVTKGEGRLDQVFSIVLGPKWGFREPSQIGNTGKYREYNVQGAKQMLSAAGVNLPLESTFTHIEQGFVGQALFDMVTLTVAQWRENGVANVRDNVVPFATATTTMSVGNYEGITQSLNPIAPVPGPEWKNLLWSPPEGVKAPTTNIGHINDTELNGIIDKQLTQLNFDERKQTLRRAEDIMAEELYRASWSTFGTSYFSDPSLRNNVVPMWSYAYSSHYQKYWWFG